APLGLRGRRGGARHEASRLRGAVRSRSCSGELPAQSATEPSGPLNLDFGLPSRGRPKSRPNLDLAVLHDRTLARSRNGPSSGGPLEATGSPLARAGVVGTSGRL